MKRKLTVSTGTLMRLLQSAEQAMRRHDYVQAAELAERAQRLDRANVGILLFLGQLHGRNYEGAKAEQAFNLAVRLSPRPVDTLVECGKRACDFGNYELGHEYFNQAVARTDATAEAFAMLACTLERLRHPDEAFEMTARALRKNQNCADGKLIRARLLRQTGNLIEAENLLRTGLSCIDKTTSVKIWYELGIILDRQSRHDEAIAAFQEAKSLLRQDSKPYAQELKTMREQLKCLREAATDKRIEKWLIASKEMSPPRRISLLGGHPRSGTTLLEQVLDAHPKIISAEETELFYNDAYLPLARNYGENEAIVNILDNATTNQMLQSRQNYFARAAQFLGRPIDDRLLIDKNPSLTFLVPAFLRIFPEARFLIALRDPRDVCLSCFMQFFPLNQASAAFLSLEDTVNEYCELMGMWLALRTKLQGQAVEVRYEDMVADLEPVARKTLEFLGVAWDPKVLDFDEHARQKAVRSPTYSDVTKKVFKTAVGRWRNYQKYFEPHLAKLEPLVKALGYE